MAGRPERLAPISPSDEDDFAEPEIPEYLLAERRRGGRGQGQGRGAGGRGVRSAYASAVDRERYGRSSTRYPEPARQAQPQRRRDERPQRQPQPQQHRGGGGAPRSSGRDLAEPWSEVPPELEELLRAQLSTKLSRQAEPPSATPSETAAAGTAAETAERPRGRRDDQGRRPPRWPAQGRGRSGRGNRGCRRGRRRGCRSARQAGEPAAGASPPRPRPVPKPPRAAKPRQQLRPSAALRPAGSRPRPRATRPRMPPASRPASSHPARAHRPVVMSGPLPMENAATRGQPGGLAAIAAMVRGSVPHAVLLVGPASSGKTTLALDLAAALLCVDPDTAARPCRACRGCRLVASGNHPDLHRLAPDGPGGQVRIGKATDPEPGTIRHLIGELALLPVEGGARVAIVEQAHRINDDAQNALLKMLEEPPAGVTIVLCADEEECLLPTVRSRCVRVRLGPVAGREIERWLGELGVADAPSAARFARLAGGCPGLALAYARAPEAARLRGEIARGLLDLLTAGRHERLTSVRTLMGSAAALEAALERAAKPVRAETSVSPKLALGPPGAARNPRAAAAADHPAEGRTGRRRSGPIRRIGRAEGFGLRSPCGRVGAAGHLGFGRTATSPSRRWAVVAGSTTRICSTSSPPSRQRFPRVPCPPSSPSWRPSRPRSTRTSTRSWPSTCWRWPGPGPAARHDASGRGPRGMTRR